MPTDCDTTELLPVISAIRLSSYNDNFYLLMIAASEIPAQTIRQKDRWGVPVYYFECIPEKRVIACIVL